MDRMMKDGQYGGVQDMIVEEMIGWCKERIVHNDGGGQKGEER